MAIDQHTTEITKSPTSKPALSRRRFLRGGLQLAGVAAVAPALLGEAPFVYAAPAVVPARADNDNNAGVESEAPRENPSFFAPFDDDAANEIMRERGMTAGDFFLFRPEIMNQLDAFVAAPEIDPLLPPSVVQHREKTYQLSDETGFAPNEIDALMTIESFGKVDAGSYAGAQGPFQVMPFHFPPEERTPAIMHDFMANGRVAMKYLQQCLDKARGVMEKTAKINKNHITIHAVAFAGYNGGGGLIEKGEDGRIHFEEWPSESRLYTEHAVRRATEVQLVADLREKGYSNTQIVDALGSSDEIKKRTYALRSNILRAIQTKGRYSYEEYSDWLKALSLEVPGMPHPDVGEEITTQIGKDYDMYDVIKEAGQLNDLYDLPLGPATFIWLATTKDESLLRHDKRNLDPEAYRHTITAREE